VIKKPRRCALAALACAALSCASAREAVDGPPVVAFDRSPETAAADLPFSDAVRIGDLLFLSGQLGIRPGATQLVPGGIEAETAQCLDNIRAILERNGSSLDRVVKCTAFLADMAEWPALNAVYRRYFPRALPARSAFAASGLAYGARIELECIAAAGAGR
jgi:reactive intermediate/imine deaminase